MRSATEQLSDVRLEVNKALAGATDAATAIERIAKIAGVARTDRVVKVIMPDEPSTYPRSTT